MKGSQLWNSIQEFSGISCCDLDIRSRVGGAHISGWIGGHALLRSANNSPTSLADAPSLSLRCGRHGRRIDGWMLQFHRPYGSRGSGQMG
jgi:hypothetical protein